MSHIVRSLPRDPAETNLAYCTELLRKAHTYLVERGQSSLAALGAGGDTAAWGRRIKRVIVTLDGERPLLVEAIGTHNLIEVINQCATIERLIDALVWAQGEPDLQGLSVARCHPATSSQRDSNDNDLVLSDAQGTIRACFEVSDVSGQADGNGKERKDLVSLGIVSDATGQVRHRPSGCRRFLVVSSGFARYITNRRSKVPRSFVYRPVLPAKGTTAQDDATHILELVTETPHSSGTS